MNDSTLSMEFGGEQRTLRFGQFSYDLSIERWNKRGSPVEENPEHACAEVIYACLVHEYHAKEKNVDFDIDDIRFWQLEYILKNGFDAFTELANRIRQKLIDSIVPDSNN